jgi:peptide/nickel transport system ATP-binding protein
MSDALLQVDQLKTWLETEQGMVRAVDGISFTLRRNQTFALLGESGCGKSMTALTIMRLLPAAARVLAGSVQLEQRDLLQLPENAMRGVRGGRIAMIFQEPQSSLNPVLTVGDQIGETVRRHAGASGGAVVKRVIELLDEVGIPDPQRRVREYPHQLSGGMKQRVMIANALAGEPDLLIADEPTTALDVTIQAQVLALLKRLQRREGMAILLITHDLGVVAEMADEVAVMYAGQLVEQAPCHDFFAAPRHPYSQKLFASLPESDKRGSALAVIRGSVPSLSQELVGCRFAPRCERAWELCREQVPSWIEDSSAQQGVRCHLYGPAAQQTPSPTDATGEASEHDTLEEPGSEQASLLQVNELQVHFPIQKGLLRRTVGWVRAVDGISLRIGKGRTLALVGESGCGKTTAGKGILQLIRPTGGSVRFNGAELTNVRGANLRGHRRFMQIVFQDPVASMNPRMMVGDIIEEGMVAQGVGGSRPERRKRVSQLLEQVGLNEDARERYPHEFSGGQRQRICIARALAVEPQLLVCDEPTSALDVSVQAQILNLLRELQHELGLAYLFITHNISVVEYLAHEVAVMYLGRIVEHGQVDEILRAPRHPYTRALLSAVPSANPRSERQVIRLEGELPSPAAPPAGCHFHPRCPEAQPRCREAYPPPYEVSPTHRTSCILCEPQD